LRPSARPGYDFQVQREVKIHRARAAGEYARRGTWSGRLVSVHRGALNLLREDGLLVSVVAEESFMTAMSVLVPSVFIRSDLDGLVGFHGELLGTRILIPGLSSIELAEGGSWTGRVGGEAAKSVPRDGLPTAERALRRFGKPGGLLGLLSRGRRGPHGERALRALAAGRPELLVGLGPGMTPAGDDFLAGALLARYAGFYDEPSGRALDPAAIEAALPGTAPAGRTLLWLALRGSFPSYLCSFVERLAAAATEPGIVETVRAACLHGETSGTDALVGFFFAVGGGF
jgi:hypothetical protein